MDALYALGVGSGAVETVGPPVAGGAAVVALWAAWKLGEKFLQWRREVRARADAAAVKAAERAAELEVRALAAKQDEWARLREAVEAQTKVMSDGFAGMRQDIAVLTTKVETVMELRPARSLGELRVPAVVK